MKRDMDLVRRILLELEKSPDSNFVTFHLEGVHDNNTNYHIQLLVDAGLIRQIESGGMYNFGRYSYWYRLSWQGHEFLDLMKKDTNWNKAKEIMAQTGGMAFEILIKVLLQHAAGQVGLL